LRLGEADRADFRRGEHRVGDVAMIDLA